MGWCWEGCWLRCYLFGFGFIFFSTGKGTGEPNLPSTTTTSTPKKLFPPGGGEGSQFTRLLSCLQDLGLKKVIKKDILPSNKMERFRQG